MTTTVVAAIAADAAALIVVVAVVAVAVLPSPWQHMRMVQRWAAVLSTMERAT